MMLKRPAPSPWRDKQRRPEEDHKRNFVAKDVEANGRHNTFVT